MSAFRSLRPFVLVIVAVCLLAGAFSIRYFPSASPASDKSGERANERRPDTDLGQASRPRLLICAVEECPKSQPVHEPAPIPKQGGDEARLCGRGDSCPPGNSRDGEVHCLALGCPTDEDKERPVSSDDPTPPTAPTPPDNDATSGNISSFDECVAAGYPVAESYPEQCVSPYGTFRGPG